MADRTEARRNLEESEIRISRTLASHSVFSRERDVPGWPKVAINELHRHLTINNLDDVHRGAAGRIAAALCTDDEFTARAISDVRATYAIKALCLHVRVRACVSTRALREKGSENRREGTERERERDIRIQRDGYPVFRYYDRATMRCRSDFAAISGIPVFRGLFHPNRACQMIIQRYFHNVISTLSHNVTILIAEGGSLYAIINYALTCV